jgi:catechol 2,3-dioxygenase-like lactoylglutathione lyase family enzyme
MKAWRASTLVLFMMIATVLLVIARHGVAQDAPHRPHILGIAQVAVPATDVGKTTLFYEKTLGLPPVGGAHEDNIYFLGEQSRIALQKSSPDKSTSIEIGFLTDDVAAMRAFIVAGGFQPSSLNRLSRSDGDFRMQDPDGHWIAFFQRSYRFHANEKTDPRVGSDLIHAGFVVHDRAVEDHFYRDLLGFRLYWHGGMKDSETDWVDMQVPDGTSWLEYMLNVPANADHHTLGVMNHFAIGVPDIHAAYDRLVANGWKPSEQPKIGRDGKWQLNLYDPDGTRVELMEFTPTEKPCCSPYVGPHPGPQQPNPPSTLKISRLSNPQSAAPAQPRP